MAKTTFLIFCFLLVESHPEISQSAQQSFREVCFLKWLPNGLRFILGAFPRACPAFLAGSRTSPAGCGAGAGVDSVWEQKKLEAGKCLKMIAPPTW